MEVGDWLFTFLITIVPIVNILALFFWAFTSNVNINRSNWAKASLYFFAFWIIMYIILLPFQ
jgi:hypothetical protein